MPYNCAWCLKAGATHKIPMGTDGSTQGWRYFCDLSHQVHWETNQPRPFPGGVPLEAGSIWEIIKEANLNGWFLVGLSQYGIREKIQYRASFQRRRPNGASEEVFTTVQDAPDPRRAVLDAYRAAQAIDKANKPKPSAKLDVKSSADRLPAKWEARLDKAADAMWAAVRLYGARSRN